MVRGVCFECTRRWDDVEFPEALALITVARIGCGNGARPVRHFRRCEGKRSENYFARRASPRSTDHGRPACDRRAIDWGTFAHALVYEAARDEDRALMLRSDFCVCEQNRLPSS